MSTPIYQSCFTKRTYLTAIDEYQRTYQKKFYREPQRLIVAKAYFLSKRYQDSIAVLKQIPTITTKQILYQKQALFFQANYMLNPSNITLLADIVTDFQTLQPKCKGKPLTPFHHKAINQLALLLKYKQGDKLVKQKEELEEEKLYRTIRKGSKFQGFPSYLVEKHWMYKWEKYLKYGGEHPGPIANLSLINHISNLIFYEQPSKSYMNVAIFPTEEYESVNKSFWNELSKLYGGYPVKRVFVYKLWYNRKVLDGDDNLVKVVVNHGQSSSVIQVLPNTFYQTHLATYLGKIMGKGQLKVENEIKPQWSEIVEDKEIANSSVVMRYITIQFLRENLNVNEEQRMKKIMKLFDLERYNIEGVKREGGSGLANLRNSCYMNASLQCLNNIVYFSEYFIKSQFVKELNISDRNVLGSKGLVTCAFAEVMKQLWKGPLLNKKHIYPQKFKRQFGIRFISFNNDNQQDANEFLSFLLNCIHDDLNRALGFRHNSITKLTTFQQIRNNSFENQRMNNKSIVHQLFRGYSYSEIQCNKCSEKLYRFDIFLMLTVPLPPVGDCVTAYLVHDEIGKNPQQIKLYISSIKTAGDLISGMKNLENKSKEYIMMIIDNASFKIEQIVDNKFQMVNCLTLKKKNCFFIYEIPQSKQSEDLCIVSYYYDGQKLGYSKIINIPTKYLNGDAEEKLQEILLENLPHSKEKERFIQEGTKKKELMKEIRVVKKQKSKHYKYQLKVLMTRKIPLHYYSESSKIVGKESENGMKLDLISCIKKFLEREVIDADAGFKCQKCKDVTIAYKKEVIYFLNNILIITLKRFKQGQKINMKIDYPVYGLDLSEFVDLNVNEKPIYNLQCVCIHRGSLHYGHYVSICKSKYDGKWYYYDDSDCKEVKESELVSQNAYILFYERVK